jgi:uncharacterized protein (TIGR03437 family)
MNKRWAGLLVLFLAVPLSQTVAQTSPTLGAGSIVNGASFAQASAANGALAPGALVSAFGGNLASATQLGLSVPLTTNLNGSTLTFFAGSTPFAAPLFFVSAGQINAQVPFNVPLNSAITAQVNFNGQLSTPISVSVISVSPGIFFSADANGNNIGAIVDNNSFAGINSSNPAVAGEFLDIFCTGLGAVNPPAASGAAGPSSPNIAFTVATPTVTLAGQAITPVFSALAPTFVGLYQVAFQVPANVPSGKQSLTLSINGVTSNVVTLFVQ